MSGRNKLQKEPSNSDGIARTDQAPQSTAPIAESSSSAGHSSFSETISAPLTQASSRAKAVLRKPVSSGNRASVRIRRQLSSQSITQAAPPSGEGLHDIQEESSRRRSSSEPHRPAWLSPNRNTNGRGDDGLARSTTAEGYLPPIEEGTRQQIQAPPHLVGHLAPHLAPHIAAGMSPERAAELAGHVEPHTAGYPQTRPTMLSRSTNAARSVFGLRNRGAQDREGSESGSTNVETGHSEDEYDSEMVDLLDVIDPEISTLSTLTNVQNSLFIPHLGSLLNRRPTYNLTRQGTATTTGAHVSRPPTATDREREEEKQETDGTRPALTHSSTISSTLSESRYAVLPHGERLVGWTEEEKAELNDLVRHMLHSRRAGFKRGFKGFKQYVKKPLGLFVTIYATLITLFGLAWVLFLIGWISVGSKKDYLVNVIDNVLVALFAIMGDGLIPFRTVDTYHMIYIAHYHHLTWSLRKKARLQKLEDHNDLPAQPLQNIDVEAAPCAVAATEDKFGQAVSVLTPAQQKKLEHHQKKFSRSHTFYKPHETETHHAFPLRLLVAIVVILDCHSLLQVALGACTWGINYKVRPFALTTVILCCSITCNITGGVLISIGDRRTRKKEVIERMFRQDLTSAAIKKVEKRRLRELEQSGELDHETEQRMEEELKKNPEEEEEIKRSWKNLYKKPKKEVQKKTEGGVFGL